ncbi:hypothetical protein [Actinomarinicola tropica]|uniref:Uncharacterized protein n=1 Tax=Actinomarinicola tropica TaxID=2789776 RepID=A0A5Q2RKQ5_9ACTN|nr:hypothetical protein [Actinomarinicola tropica]QGG95161.1 hypothetical protein GH723_08650 [Actinomarinicola tropica]
MEWYAVLFWIWLVVSLAILVLRRLNVIGTSSRTEEPPAVDPASRVWAPPPTDPDAPLTPDPAPGGAPASPPVPSSIRVEEVPAAHVPPPTRATLAELLAGITLPHELVPLTQSLDSTDLATHLVVATTRATPEVVGTGLAEELEKLGYEVRSLDDRRAVAEGERGRVSLEIHPDGATVMDGGARRFPTAESGSVVVELRAG